MACGRDKNRSFSIDIRDRFSSKWARRRLTMGVGHVRGSSCWSESGCSACLALFKMPPEGGEPDQLSPREDVHTQWQAWTNHNDEGAEGLHRSGRHFRETHMEAMLWEKLHLSFQSSCFVGGIPREKHTNTGKTGKHFTERLLIQWRVKSWTLLGISANLSVTTSRKLIYDCIPVRIRARLACWLSQSSSLKKRRTCASQRKIRNGPAEAC